MCQIGLLPKSSFVLTVDPFRYWGLFEKSVEFWVNLAVCMVGSGGAVIPSDSGLFVLANAFMPRFVRLRVAPEAPSCKKLY